MATSHLQKLTGARLRKLFGKHGVVENTRPDWLISSHGERLELDFFIDRLSVAVEVQGRQHVEFIPHFHESRWHFEQQVRRDKEKARICERSGIELLYVFKKGDVPDILGKIDTLACRENDVPLDGIILELAKPVEKTEDSKPRVRRSYPFTRVTIAIRDYVQSIESGQARHSREKIGRKLAGHLDRIPKGYNFTAEEKKVIDGALAMLKSVAAVPSK